MLGLSIFILFIGGFCKKEIAVTVLFSKCVLDRTERTPWPAFVVCCAVRSLLRFTTPCIFERMEVFRTPLSLKLFKCIVKCRLTSFFSFLLGLSIKTY